MAAPGMIEIPIEEYEQLMKDSDWLGYLEAAGVDNWEGFGYAIEAREEAEAAIQDVNVN
jgi:hypothetical protein